MKINIEHPKNVRSSKIRLRFFALEYATSAY